MAGLFESRRSQSGDGHMQNEQVPAASLNGLFNRWKPLQQWLLVGFTVTFFLHMLARISRYRACMWSLKPKRDSMRIAKHRSERRKPVPLNHSPSKGLHTGKFLQTIYTHCYVFILLVILLAIHFPGGMVVASIIVRAAKTILGWVHHWAFMLGIHCYRLHTHLAITIGNPNKGQEKEFHFSYSLPTYKAFQARIRLILTCCVPIIISASMSHAISCMENRYAFSSLLFDMCSDGARFGRILKVSLSSYASDLVIYIFKLSRCHAGSLIIKIFVFGFFLGAKSVHARFVLRRVAAPAFRNSEHITSCAATREIHSPRQGGCNFISRCVIAIFVIMRRSSKGGRRYAS